MVATSVSLTGPCLAQGTFALGHPSCSQKAVTEQSIVFSNEYVEVLKTAISNKSNAVKQSFQISPPAYSTTGWAQDLINKVQEKVTQILNEVKDNVIRQMDSAANKCVDDIQAEVAKLSPNIRFSGLYTFQKNAPDVGSWSDLSKYPVGPHTLSIKGGAGFKLAGTVGLGVEVTVPTELKGSLTGMAKLTTPASVLSYPPKGNRSLKVSTETAVDVTAAFEIEVKVGFTLVAGSSITVTVPGKDASATLDAGKGLLLYPEKKEESYDPICE